MDKVMAKKFLEELFVLEQKHGIHISSSYEEVIEFDEFPHTPSIQSYLTLVDAKGNVLDIDEVEFI